MFCSQCGIQLDEKACYCSRCGTSTANVPTAATKPPDRPLSRSRQDKKIAGVCAGVARYFDIDVTLTRIVWLVAAVCPPNPGLIAYIICWIVMPKDPEPLRETSMSAARTT